MAIGLILGGIALAGGIAKTIGQNRQEKRNIAAARRQANDAENILGRQYEAQRDQLETGFEDATTDLAVQERMAQQTQTVSAAARGIQGDTVDAISGNIEAQANQQENRLGQQLEQNMRQLDINFDEGMNQIEAMRRGAADADATRKWNIASNLINTGTSAASSFMGF